MAAQTDAPNSEARVTKQFRIDPDTWSDFTASVGEKNASPVIRRLVALYLQHEPTMRRVKRTADPSPDRRPRQVEL